MSLRTAFQYLLKLVQMGDGSCQRVEDNQPEPHIVLEIGTGRFHGAGGCKPAAGQL